MAVVISVDTINLATKDDLALMSLNRNLVFSVIGAVVATATAVITAAQLG